MSSAADRLRSVVADAIAVQLPSEVDESQLPRDVAVLLTADRLVRDALSAGHAGAADVSEVLAFGAGNTAMMVARVHARMAYVVKVDTSPQIVQEAHLLRRMTTDRLLPAATRAAFPSVFAIDDTPPLFGYLMELVEDAEPIHHALQRHDPASGGLIRGLWEQILEPAYAATRDGRLAHNVHEDYFARARTRLRAAAESGALPAPECPLVVDDGVRTVRFRAGWGGALVEAETLLTRAKPGFGTWVHGDPNPENALWHPGPDGSIAYRLLDPKNWWIGDYLFDAAKLGHYAAVTAPTEAGEVEATATTTPDRVALGYDSSALAWGRSVEADLLPAVGRFAEAAGDSRWQERYRLAFAANLLGIAGPRAERALAAGDEGQRRLATVALGAGLMALADAGES